jgi:hypothetical protein
MRGYEPFPRLTLLARRVGFGFEFVDQLVELVEINSGPETERMRNDFWRRSPTPLRLLAETGAQCAVDHLLEGQPQFARSPFQESGQIVIYGERSAHQKASWLLITLMSRHHIAT